MNETQENSMRWQSVVQTIGIGVMTVALAWAGGTLRQMYDAMIEQREAMTELRSDLTEMRGEVKDIRQQLAQVPTQREIDARFDAFGRRLDRLERGK